MVKVKYEKFLEYYHNHKNLLNTTQKMQEKVVGMRDVVDNLILKIWNGIEEAYNELSAEDKRNACSDYGVVYMLRKERDNNGKDREGTGRKEGHDIENREEKDREKEKERKSGEEKKKKKGRMIGKRRTRIQRGGKDSKATVR